MPFGVYCVPLISCVHLPLPTARSLLQQQVLSYISDNPHLQQQVLSQIQAMRAAQRPPVPAPPLPRDTQIPPSISDGLSSQSSDEDMTGPQRRRGRRGGSEGESRQVPISSLVKSVSANVREQALSHTESSSEETTASELMVVPDPEEDRKRHLEKTVAKVPKIPSQLKRSLV